MIIMNSFWVFNKTLLAYFACLWRHTTQYEIILRYPIRNGVAIWVAVIYRGVAANLLVYSITLPLYV